MRRQFFHGCAPRGSWPTMASSICAFSAVFETTRSAGAADPARVALRVDAERGAECVSPSTADAEQTGDALERLAVGLGFEQVLPPPRVHVEAVARCARHDVQVQVKD